MLGRGRDRGDRIGEQAYYPLSSSVEVPGKSNASLQAISTVLQTPLFGTQVSQHQGLECD